MTTLNRKQDLLAGLKKGARLQICGSLAAGARNLVRTLREHGGKLMMAGVLATSIAACTGNAPSPEDTVEAHNETLTLPMPGPGEGQIAITNHIGGMYSPALDNICIIGQEPQYVSMVVQLHGRHYHGLSEVDLDEPEGASANRLTQVDFMRQAGECYLHSIMAAKRAQGDALDLGAMEPVVQRLNDAFEQADRIAEAQAANPAEATKLAEQLKSETLKSVSKTMGVLSLASKGVEVVREQAGLSALAADYYQFDQQERLDYTRVATDLFNDATALSAQAVPLDPYARQGEFVDTEYSEREYAGASFRPEAFEQLMILSANYTLDRLEVSAEKVQDRDVEAIAQWVGQQQEAGKSTNPFAQAKSQAAQQLQADAATVAPSSNPFARASSASTWAPEQDPSSSLEI